MTDIAITTENGLGETEKTYRLTRSKGGLILVDADTGVEYGPDDVTQIIDKDIFGERVEITASTVVSNWAKNHMPAEYRKLDSDIKRFAMPPVARISEDEAGRWDGAGRPGETPEPDAHVVLWKFLSI